MNTKVKQLNLQKYLPLFECAPEISYALGIFNHFGKQLVFVSSDLLPKHRNVLHSINKQVDWDSISESHNHLSLNNTNHLLFTPLTLGAHEHSYWLVGVLQTEIPLTQEQLATHGKKLKQIAVCLTEDFNLTETISGMADELAVRYEELNLLYGMDDIETFYKNNDEQTSLNQLVANCVDYLNIDYAAIYIQDQDFFTHQLGHSQALNNEDYLEQIIRQKLYEYIRSNPETLVINRDNDIDWTDANLHIPNKLIAAPIVKANQNPCGFLILINTLAKPDFSNSDRKLAEVLAAEASKLTQARRDPTTGQLNRRGFTEKLEATLAQAETTDTENTLLFLDIDQFKIINDTAGQIGGDLLLKQITTLLLKNLKKSDILGRLGSDEFTIILKDCNLDHATDIAERIRIVIKQFRFLHQEKMFDLSTCIGVVELNSDIKNFSQALSAADLACSVAKEQGRNRVHVYQLKDEMTLKHENLMQWVSKINIGLEENRFQLYRQKIQPLQGQPDQDEHYEILIRLKGINGEILSPFHFIPAAERYNLMSKIDRWVIKETLSKMTSIFAQNPESKLTCSINLSGQSFCENGFVAYIKDQINLSGVPARHVCFEMTETAAVSNLTQAVQFMEELKQIGCRFSLDDFGSGMSSFTYLKNLPVDYLKIDGYFVKTMIENNIDQAMVRSIHQIGNVMGLKTIAEFVENDAIMAELKKMGVDYGQGYGIGKPEPFV